jgi:branched-chain amino acid transport system ATP-binding protein
MLDVIRKIRERGITLIMIEHLMHAVMNVSDHVVALDYGRKIAEGTPQAVTNDRKSSSIPRRSKVAERFMADLE